MRTPERIVRLKTVLSRTGLSRSTIYRKIADGTFPPRIKISVKGAGWYDPISTAGSPILPRGAPPMTMASATQRRPAMAPADVPDPEGLPLAANDNGGTDGPDPEALRKVNAVALRLARMIGRRMAREDFAAHAAKAANDNNRED